MTVVLDRGLVRSLPGRLDRRPVPEFASRSRALSWFSAIIAITLTPVMSSRLLKAAHAGWRRLAAAPVLFIDRVFDRLRHG